MAEDRDLVVLLKAGNADALEQLIVRWRSRAEAYATSILHDSQSAEDAVQEAFSRIYAVRTGLDEDRSFSAYRIYSENTKTPGTRELFLRFWD